ncbi:MAG TPA: endo-1,4-beta-xylanase [Bacteroidales bacterium]|nr:endo-1,4-beta-xylanase [Bacteroidales bacterium]
MRLVWGKIQLITLLITLYAGISIAQPLAQGQEKFLGCAWSSAQNTDFAKYFNQVTPENGGKWGTVENTRNVMNWNAMDAAYNLAGNNNYTFKYHTLIWGSQQPAWIENLDTATQREEIEQWFALGAARYGNIDYIDVVNEPLHAPPSGAGHGNYINALGGGGSTGWDWVIRSFRLARKYYPGSKLLLNEYNIVNSVSNTADYLEIIRLLMADSLIDGIGVQGHAFSTYGVSAATIRRNLDSLGATGLPVYVSELDIDGATDYAQLKEYQRVFPVFWEHTAVAGVTLWGFRYGLWRNSQKAYLVNQNGSERIAFDWLKAYVNDTLTVSQSVTIGSDDENDTIFIDETLQLRAILYPENTTIKNVSWSLLTSGIATINENGLLTPTSTGIVRVHVSSWDAGRVAVKDIVITNRPVDSIVITLLQDTINTGQYVPVSAIAYPEKATNREIIWTAIPEGSIDITDEGLLSPSATGDITIIATAGDGSGVSDSVRITVIQPTGISETDNTNFRIYPNPAPDGKFKIENAEGIKSVAIIDLQGRIISEFNGLYQHSLQVEVSTSPGMYLIRLTDGNRVYYRKIQIE